MMNCIVIEDEPLAVEKLVGFIEKTPTLNLLNTFDSGIAAIEFLQNNSVDLLFLDIEMKELTGFQLLQTIKLNAKVIITTAYEKYAIKGFELQVSDYLLKPITYDRFLQACDKVQTEIKKATNQDSHKKIFVKTEYRLEGIDTSEVLYIEGMGDYRRIIMPGKKIMTLQSFHELQALLPAGKFCRVHNSYIVSLDKIEKIERNRIKIQEQLIPVSESYRKSFYNKIN